MKIKKLPNILALHLKRFKYQEDLQKYIKLSYRVAFPFELRLFNTVDDAPDPDRLFQLFAIVVHIGKCVIVSFDRIFVTDVIVVAQIMDIISALSERMGRGMSSMMTQSTPSKRAIYTNILERARMGLDMCCFTRQLIWKE